jgi:hypothetical protein
VIAPLLDRLLLAEAHVEDARIAALHAVMTQTAAAATALTIQDSTAFGAAIQKLAAPEVVAKKKKKKKG